MCHSIERAMTGDPRLDCTPNHEPIFLNHGNVFLIGTKIVEIKHNTIFPVFKKSTVPYKSEDDGSLSHEVCEQGITFKIPTNSTSYHSLWRTTRYKAGTVLAGIHISPILVKGANVIIPSTDNIIDGGSILFAIFQLRDILFYDGYDVSVKKFWYKEAKQLATINDVLEYLKPDLNKIERNL